MKKILHIGVGNFHRAHQAWYTQGTPGWEIIGVSLRSAAVRKKLASQDFEYTLVTKDQNSTRYDRINILGDVIVAADNPEAVLEQIADPATKIVSVTVTENGYCLAADGDNLNLQHPEIKADLGGGLPTTLPGFLAVGLARRWQNNDCPITILSCDNLPDNGHKLRKAVNDFAEIAGLGISSALGDKAAFPNSMVDRITPATTQALLDEVADATGKQDSSPVETETFSEWVMQDSFATERPDWENRGAVFVPDVSPFEHRKLRMLNGAHSYLAYVGLQSGHEYVHQAIADPRLLAGVQALFNDAIPTLPAAAQTDAKEYADSLIQRFLNPALKHRLSQIAMDGSLKIPIRWLPVLQQSPESKVIREGLAAWVCLMFNLAHNGQDIADPQAEEIAQVCRQANDVSAAVNPLLNQFVGTVQNDVVDDIETLCRNS